MSNWRDLEEFPDYCVSDQGELMNVVRESMLRTSYTREGHAKVTLYRDGLQFTRSVAKLVARKFVYQPAVHFDTTIHLNGEFPDCRASNLMWRPRWFAIMYHKQFSMKYFRGWDIDIIDIGTNERYKTMDEVCTVNGILYADVVHSVFNESSVPITHQSFRQVLK